VSDQRTGPVGGIAVQAPGEASPRRGVPWSSLGFLLTHVSAGVVAIDDLGDVTFASAGLRSLLGYDPASLVGRNGFALLHPDDLDYAVAALSRWSDRAGVNPGPELRIRHADGTWIPVLVDAVTGPAVATFGAVVLTVRRRSTHGGAEQELRVRLANEDRLTRIATSFVSVPWDRFDEGVDAALVELGSQQYAGRVSVWRVDGPVLRRTHTWVAPAGGPVGALPEELPRGAWEVLARLEALEEIDVSSVRALAASGEAGWVALHRGGVRSLLAAPLVGPAGFAGLLAFEVGLEEITFDAGHLTTLRVAAGIIAEAFTRHDAERELAFEAQHDPLTGLDNRWRFLDELSRAVAALPADGSGGVAVLEIDLDRFKSVNDTFGHGLGDRLLQQVASRCLAQRAAGERMARFGGDEILVLVPDCATVDAAVGRARALSYCFDEPWQVAGQRLTVRASIGLGHTTDPSTPPARLLQEADAAMYRAKDRGRNRIEPYDDELRRAAARRLHRSQVLRGARRADALRLVYRPEVDLRTGAVRAVEALLSWPEVGDEPPPADEIEDAARDAGIVQELDRWVLRAAVGQLAEWHRASAVPEVVRVRLSDAAATGTWLLDELRLLLARHAVDARHLAVTFSESALMADVSAARVVLDGLRELGLGVVVGSFGTGASSLSALKRLRLDAVVVDRSFVAGLAADRGDRAVVDAVVQIGRVLNVRVVAEGVDTPEQLAEVVALGCGGAMGPALVAVAPAASAVLDGTVALR
jgi:diguanylate cyclase (GGDEF)-like protein/PAS domain S-box-containing protein